MSIMNQVLLFPAVRLFAPVLLIALGPELQHWVETIIDAALKLLCVVFAWYLQTVVSAFYSALRGGRMFARGFFTLLDEHGALSYLPARCCCCCRVHDTCRGRSWLRAPVCTGPALA